ncbi:MAG TPA: response regulator [Bacteroidales bacterium]|nr:response regulator [Bacteroidales bacterium]
MMTVNLQAYTVLVVEDDAMSYKFLEIVLSKKTGINIVWAIDGQQALEYCKIYRHIDIVLTDLQLPVMDGTELIRQVKLTSPHIPIIVQSANSLHDEMEKCAKLGCDVYLTKPINSDLLIKHIDALLRPVASKTA